jgi:hypothetical protein
MVLEIHSNASYLLEANAMSRAGGHMFLTNPGQHTHQQQSRLNILQIIKAVMSSAADADMGAILSAKMAVSMCACVIWTSGYRAPSANTLSYHSYGLYVQ